MLRIAIVLLVGLAVASSGCKSLTDPRPEGWASLQLDDITYPDLFSVVLTTLDAEGYLVRERNPEQGRLATDWQYGTSQSEYRGPSRRRVVAQLERLEEGGLELKLRVEEEVIFRGGILATNLRDSEAWEPVDDNFHEAEFLMAKIRGVLSSTAP